MGFKKPVVPATTKQAVCSVTVDKKTAAKCGKPANNTIEGQAEIFGKIVNLKLMVCDDHIERFTNDRE